MAGDFDARLRYGVELAVRRADARKAVPVPQNAPEGHNKGRER